MAVTKKTPAKNETIVIEPLQTDRHIFALVGTSPLILNRMATKAKRELLFPETKTAATLASRLKHEPLIEYRDSIYQRRLEDTGPTRIVFPAPAFKGVMGTAALETKGATKASIGRLTWCIGHVIDVWGAPQLLMSVVRNSDMNRTPDIRTRAILPNWCALIEVAWTLPRVNETTVANLLHNGGMICGIGDWRQEKGSGSNGQYRLCNLDNKEKDTEMAELMSTAGMKAQDAAIASPKFFDFDTEDLFNWFYEELQTRGEQRKSKAQKAPIEAVVAERALQSGIALDQTGDHDGLSPGNGRRRPGRPKTKS